MVLMALRLVAVSLTVASAAQTYRAAVVEFAPKIADALTAADAEAMTAHKLSNLAGLEVFAREAKANGTQIMVFPEYGITGDNLPGLFGHPRQHVFNYTEDESAIVGTNPRVAVPCGDAATATSAPVITRASCIAQELEMVLVIDLLTRYDCEAGRDGCPKDGMFVYNSAVAFAEDGKVLRVYHKRHASENENAFMDTGDDSYRGGVTFTTSFGVKFGMFICFDILFFSDGGPDAREIIYPTEWSNDVLGPIPEPVGARAVQRSWSALHRKNLLAANYGGFGQLASGSGIWHKGAPLAQFYNPTKEAQNKLLIADVPILAAEDVAV